MIGEFQSILLASMFLGTVYSLSLCKNISLVDFKILLANIHQVVRSGGGGGGVGGGRLCTLVFVRPANAVVKCNDTCTARQCAFYFLGNKGQSLEKYVSG